MCCYICYWWIKWNYTKYKLLKVKNMIIKVNGADFSENNLGQVIVTTELDDFTKAAIVASGNNSLTETQKAALNELFLAMGVDGSNNVMSKIHRLYLPMIAGDVSHALINYKDLSFTNDKSDLDSTKWTLRSHGIVGTASGQNINLTESDVIMQNDFFGLFLRTELMVSGVDDTTYPFVLRGKTVDSKFLGFAQKSVSSNTMINVGEYGASWGNWNKNVDAIKPFAVNCASNYNDRMILGNYTHSDNAKQMNVDMSGESSQTLYVCGMNSTNIAKPYGAIIIGEALNSQDFVNITNAVDVLYSSIVNY